MHRKYSAFVYELCTSHVYLSYIQCTCGIWLLDQNFEWLCCVYVRYTLSISIVMWMYRCVWTIGRLVYWVGGVDDVTRLIYFSLILSSSHSLLIFSLNAHKLRNIVQCHKMRLQWPFLVGYLILCLLLCKLGCKLYQQCNIILSSSTLVTYFIRIRIVDVGTEHAYVYYSLAYGSACT